MENFTIRLLEKKDASEFYTLLHNNKSRLEDFFVGTIKHTATLIDTETYCETISKRIEREEYFPYLIFNNSKAIGFIDFKNIDWTIPKAELGAFIDVDFEGKGFLSKSFDILLASVIKKHQFKRLFCRISNENTRSIQLALRCGFTFKKSLINEYTTSKGEIIDLDYYEKQL